MVPLGLGAEGVGTALHGFCPRPLLHWDCTRDAPVPHWHCTSLVLHWSCTLCTTVRVLPCTVVPYWCCTGTALVRHWHGNTRQRQCNGGGSVAVVLFVSRKQTANNINNNGRFRKHRRPTADAQSEKEEEEATQHATTSMRPRAPIAFYTRRAQRERARKTDQPNPKAAATHCISYLSASTRCCFAPTAEAQVYACERSSASRWPSASSLPARRPQGKCAKSRCSTSKASTSSQTCL